MSTIALKLIETDSKFLEVAGSAITVNGNEYFSLPFWYKKIGDGLFVEYRFEDLPQELKNELQIQREPVNEITS